MQNRRIIDRAIRDANCAPVPRLETNSVINLCANVHLMGLVSIIPEYFLEIMGPISDVRAVLLTDPLVEHGVGLVAVDRDPVSPLVLAAFDCARITEPRRFPEDTRPVHKDRPYGRDAPRTLITSGPPVCHRSTCSIRRSSTAR